DAIEFQLNLGCNQVILPAPLISEREDEAATLGEWLDHGLAVGEEMEVGQPLLATIAVEESVLRNNAFEDGGFLDAVVDQVASREGIEGVYIVVLQTLAEHPFTADSSVLRAYLHLCRRFRDVGYTTIIVNFV